MEVLFAVDRKSKVLSSCINEYVYGHPLYYNHNSSVLSKQDSWHIIHTSVAWGCYVRGSLWRSLVPFRNMKATTNISVFIIWLFVYKLPKISKTGYQGKCIDVSNIAIVCKQIFESVPSLTHSLLMSMSRSSASLHHTSVCVSLSLSRWVCPNDKEEDNNSFHISWSRPGQTLPCTGHSLFLTVCETVHSHCLYLVIIRQMLNIVRREGVVAKKEQPPFCLTLWRLEPAASLQQQAQRASSAASHWDWVDLWYCFRDRDVPL